MCSSRLLILVYPYCPSKPYHKASVVAVRQGLGLSWNARRLCKDIRLASSGSKTLDRSTDHGGAIGFAFAVGLGRWGVVHR